MRSRRQYESWAAIALLALCILPAAACFSPDYRAGLACSESGACPSGQECVSDVCQLLGSGGLADAAQAQGDAAPRADAEVQCPSGSEVFDVSGTIVNFTLPECVTTVTIEAFGGQGGGGRNGVGGGGKGARIKGEFPVTPGESFQILVGGQGLSAIPDQSLLGTSSLNLQQGGGSGGGGSYVVTALGEALLVAGGGGGATHTAQVDGNGTIIAEILLPGGEGQLSTDGQAGGGGGASGGTAGSGGNTASNPGFHNGTGGGGFTGDGNGNSNGSTANFGSANQPGKSFTNGGAGGIGGSIGRDGAFGGGGSAGFAGAGGGGYSGGGTGSVDGVYGGGGGGSLNLGNNPDNTAGVREGPGQVSFQW